MDGLPQEILENIFSYLPQNELLQTINEVCVKWKQLVSNSPILWSKIEFSSRKSQDFPCFMRHFPIVQNLIRYLECDAYNFKKIVEVDAGIKFLKLTTLCIGLTSSKDCDYIVKRCPNLDHIELKLYDAVSFNIGDCLKKLSVFKLKCFKIECFCSLSGVSFDNSIHKFIEKQTNLQKLSIGTRQDLKEKTLVDIFGLCTNLEHFDLENDCISDEVFTSSKQMLKLRSILMIESEAFSDEGLKALVERAKDLKVINLMTLSNITDKGLLYISQNCHELEDLTFGSEFRDKASKGLVHIAEGCRELKSLHCMFNFLSRDEQVISIAQSCRNLQSITLDGALYLTDRALFSLAENCVFLNSVSFSTGEFFSIYGIVSLILSCGKLKILSFSECEGISQMNLDDKEGGVSEVRDIKERYLNRIQSKERNHSAIEILDFESSTKVSNNTILQLVPLCPELKSIHAFCTSVTKDQAFEEQLFSLCKRLCKIETELDVSGFEYSD